MAAGLGFKTFTTGEVLTAADVNGYLMQGILVFANAAARTSAITSPQEGQYSFLKDTNALEYYDGAAWVGAPVGDITSVTAGTGISGGGSSGDVTITNSMATAIDAKGDLIAGTADNTFSRLAVGNDGESIVADSSASTGLRWQGNFAAGKNKIINGDFSIWQRGTSFTATGYLYTADRWVTYGYGTGTTTVSRQTFTPGTAPVAGYEGQYFLRVNSSNTSTYIGQRIEDARTFAGQTVTISLWAKSASAITNFTVAASQVFGSGGSATVTTSFTSTGSVGTSWSRLSFTATIPSVSGKTIGADSYLILDLSSGTLNNNLDIWGVQIEAGNVATAFQTATGTLAGELQAAQRYYWRLTGGSSAFAPYGNGVAYATTAVGAIINFPTMMRISPTVLEVSTLALSDTANAAVAVTGAGISHSNQNKAWIYCDTAGGLTQYRPYFVCNNNNSTTAYLGFSAEL